MESSLYFSPSAAFGDRRPEWLANTLGDHIAFHTAQGFPSLEGVKVALLGVLDDPGHAKPRGCVDAPDAVRAQLYKLYMPANKFGIADLGDIHPGNTAEDTRHALSAALAELIRLNIVPVVLGGGQGHTFTQYLAYEKLERTANLACIDARFDLGEPG
ncbi:MAG: arginase family protein, partial [Bacteroidetes bacterium]|nr:arginase family protein [Bacteroidota bacterium]